MGIKTEQQIKVPVLDSDGTLVGAVRFSDNLGPVNPDDLLTDEYHGLTKLKKSNQFVLIKSGGNKKPVAEIISQESAIENIFLSGKLQLFNQFPELKEIYDCLDTD